MTDIFKPSVTLEHQIMRKPYSRPEIGSAAVTAETVFMSCSVRVDATITVEEYHDAEFSDGNKQWEIGFDEP